MDVPDRCTTTHFSVFKAVAGAFNKTGADGLVSISKMKTHALEIMTGAVKNQFGCIPGPVKATFHVRFPDMYKFARMLVDINMFVKPRLYIMDAIVAMEGNGPRNGTPKPMNLIIMSDDPVALDATACRLMNINPELVPTNKTGMEAGMGTYLASEIEILGENIEDFIAKDFVASRVPTGSFLNAGIFKKLGDLMVPKPVIVNEKCIICKDCVRVCPAQPKALNINEGVKTPPYYNYKNCIKCYCCQEMCPVGAIEVKVPFILRKYYSMKDKK